MRYYLFPDGFSFVNAAAMAQFVIENSGSVRDTQEQVRYM
jgi:hypothetical protein